MLRAYLDDAMERPWRWGATDCCFFAGDWIRLATDRDPLGPYRGCYASAQAVARLVAAAGGLAGLVSPEMARCGFERTAAPEHGDIGILPLPGDEGGPARASLVIRDGPWWVGRTSDGLAGLRASAPIAWAILPRVP